MKKMNHTMILYLFLSNLIDLACTLLALQMGVRELNPLMTHIPVLIVYKLFAVGLLLVWLSQRQEKIAQIGLRICTLAYTILDIYHFICLLWLATIL